MSFADTVHEVIRLSSRYKARERANAVKTPEDLLTTSQPDEAEDYLNNLPDEDVYKLQTLMYLGRDRNEDIHELHEHLAGVTPNKEDAVRTMTGKIPLADYLSEGLKRAKKMGADLEAGF